MFENITEDRGQVGIGTLIVFIAMVLVAAIAAGVLVNTAGFLQATAEDAGQESVNKVTNRVDVVSVHGIVNASDPKTVDTINLTTRLAAGSGSVSLNNTTIKYLSADTATTLTNNNSVSATAIDWSNASPTEFAVNNIADDDTSFPILNSQTDRFEVVINTSVVEGSSKNGLTTGESVTLEITSRNGGTSQVILTMPQQLAGKEDGDPVAL
ncbi:archaellin/type IV pilin N-terminal domain-containing protein [Haloferax sp. YSMS24]|uniref:archaellin/type IV pilin N-terminal domain-containing protein n=1 Tax=Haloferax sp. YSMS24 TaxID=3388425 RepID=UPI00398D246D